MKVPPYGKTKSDEMDGIGVVPVSPVSAAREEDGASLRSVESTIDLSNSLILERGSTFLRRNSGSSNPVPSLSLPDSLTSCRDQADPCLSPRDSQLVEVMASRFQKMLSTHEDSIIDHICAVFRNEFKCLKNRDSLSCDTAMCRQVSETSQFRTSAMMRESSSGRFRQASERASGIRSPAGQGRENITSGSSGFEEGTSSHAQVINIGDGDTNTKVKSAPRASQLNRNSTLATPLTLPGMPGNLPGKGLVRDVSIFTKISAYSTRSKKGWATTEIQELTNLSQAVSQKGVARALRASMRASVANTLLLRNGLRAERTFQQRVYVLMNSRPVELMVSMVILLNALVMGIEVDVQMRSSSMPEDVEYDFFRIMDFIFLAAYMTELVLRIIGEGAVQFLHYKNDKLAWNIFDLFLCVTATGEEVMKRFVDSTLDVSMVRVFRILRLVRIFRIIRVMRFFRDLRVMVSGIAQSLLSLMWALLLLISIMYLVAVCVLQMAVEERTERLQARPGNLSDEDYNSLLSFFGSLDRTMYTLYQSITGGVDWGDAAHPLNQMTWTLGVFYSAYIAFAVLCVLNIVTGVFVENCNKMTALDQDTLLIEDLEARRDWLAEVKAVFEATEDGNGSLSAWQFVDKIQGDVKMQAWLRKLGVPVDCHSAMDLFSLLDMDGDGQLNFDEFAIALQHIHGSARSIDVAKISQNTRVIRRELHAVIGLLHEIKGLVADKDDAVRSLAYEGA